MVGRLLTNSSLRDLINTSSGQNEVRATRRANAMQTSAELERTYNAQAHEMVDAIAAAVANAQAGLNWLRGEPPDLEEVRQALNSMVSAGKRAAQIVVRLRALHELGASSRADGAPDS